MGKPTGQMQEDTQELLDFYNRHYNWEYNDMWRFIDNHTEEEFQEYYQTYHQLCEDYGTELVDEFALPLAASKIPISSLPISRNTPTLLLVL